MGQLGFSTRTGGLQKGDPLEAITALVPWESFRAEIEAVVLTPDEARRTSCRAQSFDAS